MNIIHQPRDKDAPLRSKRVHIRDLTEYVMALTEGGNEVEGKLLHRGALGFFTDEFVAQQAEMIALAEEAVRSPMPVHHWMVTWQEGEQPTPAQVDRAVELFLERLELTGHQVLYSMHGDTDNVHVHIAVNMVHPDTCKVVFRRNNYENAMQTAVLLEREQGWAREPGRRCRVNENGELEYIETGARPQVNARASRMETRTGVKSAQTLAVELGAPAMMRASSWHELHVNLATVGMRYERQGSGAVLWVGDTRVKASQADRACSMGALEKRLGVPFEPATPEVLAAVVKREPEPASPQPPGAGWQEYQAEREQHYSARKLAQGEHRERFGREWMAMLVGHRGARKEMSGQDWRGRGALLNMARSQLAAQQAAQKLEFKERRERARCRLQERFPRFPMYEEWLRRERTPELAEEWRYRERGAPASVGSATEEEDSGHKWMAAYARDIRDFQASGRGWDVEYRRSAREDPRTAVAFVDRGRQVDIFAHRDRVAVLAALQLAAEKWNGRLQVRGDDAYKKLCVELAVTNGWTLLNPELRRAMEEERERQDSERAKRWERERSGAGGGRSGPRGHAAAGPASAALTEYPARSAPPPQIRLPPPVTSPAEAYARHAAEVRRENAQVDVSRVDAQVAVRLRLTGYDQVAIERVIHDAAAARHGLESRPLDAYASRTARFAFGRPGSIEAERLLPQRQALLELEGRTLVFARELALPDQATQKRPGERGGGGRGD